MLQGLLILFIFQGAGELLRLISGWPIPGPVLGLLLLLAWLRLRRGVPESLNGVADGFARHLGLLFVPAAAGVVLFLPQLADVGWRIAGVLILSVVGTMAVSAAILRVLHRGEPPQDSERSP